MYVGPAWRGEKTVHPNFSDKFERNAEYHFHSFTRHVVLAAALLAVHGILCIDAHSQACHTVPFNSFTKSQKVVREFCGSAGPRTLLTSKNMHGYLVGDFSKNSKEDEVVHVCCHIGWEERMK